MGEKPVACTMEKSEAEGRMGCYFNSLAGKTLSDEGAFGAGKTHLPLGSTALTSWCLCI